MAALSNDTPKLWENLMAADGSAMPGGALICAVMFSVSTLAANYAQYQVDT
jgi:hypothetical protein